MVKGLTMPEFASGKAGVRSVLTTARSARPPKQLMDLPVSLPVWFA